MYSFKEKSRILKELINPAAVEADISLLRRLSPGDSLISFATVSPLRNAEAVLFKLLDLTTREEIRLNRREFKCETTTCDENERIPETQQVEKKISVSGEKKSSKKSKNTPASGGKGSAKIKTSK